MPDPLRQQIDPRKALTRAMGLAGIEQQGVESDDLLAAVGDPDQASARVPGIGRALDVAAALEFVDEVTGGLLGDLGGSSQRGQP